MGGNVQIRLLGPVDAIVDGHILHLGPQQRALLAALATERGRPISATRLIYLLWGDAATDSAGVTLRSHIMRLRQNLRAKVKTETISRIGDGYALVIAADDLDVNIFNARLRRGRMLLAEGDHEGAAAVLHDALSMWRGRPYTGVEFRPWVTREAERLESLRHDALMLRVDTHLATGRYAEAIADLDRLLEAHPQDENARLKLALGLYRNGQQAQASEVCREGIRILARAGLESKNLQNLQQNILRQVPELNLVAARPEQPRPRQIPPDSPQFTGREAELSRVLSLIPKTPSDKPKTIVISAISGTGGIGKTTLAIHLSHLLAPDFPDGQLYINLHGYDSAQRLRPSHVLDRFLRALGVADRSMPGELDEQMALYRSLLADQKVLIVLDNAASADQVRPLIPGNPSCFVLITSRDVLAGVVATEGAALLTLDVLSDDEAIDLLSKTTGLVWSPEQREAAREVVRHCGGLPLAVRIAGSKMVSRRSMTVYQLAETLRDERHRLRELEVGDDAVRVSFRLSYESLTPMAAALFRLLGLVAGPDFGVEVGAAMLDVSLADARSAFEELLVLHLVEPNGDGERFRFHDLVRLYARERVTEENDAQERRSAVRRMLLYYVASCDAASGSVMNTQRMARSHPGISVSPALSRRDDSLGWLEAERPNLVAATRQALELGLYEQAWQLADAQWGFFYLRKHWTDWIDTHEAALSAARAEGDRNAEAWILANLGVAYWDMHQSNISLEYSRLSVRISHEEGFVQCEARAYNGISLAYRELGEYERAIENVERALPLRRLAGDMWGEAVSLDNQALVLGHLGRYTESIVVFRLAMKAWELLADPWGEALSLTDMGRTYDQSGQPGEAVEKFRQSLTIRRNVGDRWGEGETLFFLGRALVHMNDKDGGRRCLQSALEIMTELKASEASAIRAELAGI